MEELKKAASKAAPPIPNGHLPKASAPMPSKMENAATVPVISDDESNDPKKRTRAEASGKPGSAASGAAWWAWRAGWHSRRNLLGSTRHALRPCLANLIVAWSPYVTPELWMRPSSSRFPLNLWSLSILSSWFNLSQLHDTLCTMRTASTQWPWLTTPTPRRMPWCHPLPRRLQRLWQSSEHLWSCQSKAWCLRCMMLQTLLKWHVLQLPLWLHPWKTWGIIASATTISAAMTSANLVGPRCCDWTSSNTHLGSLGFHCPALDSLPCRTWPTGLKKSGATLRSVWLVTWKEPMRSPRASLRAWIYALNQIFAWEWPTGAVRGWRGRAIQRLLQKARDLNRPVYWCRFHGCAYGLKFREIPHLEGLDGFDNKPSTLAVSSEEVPGTCGTCRVPWSGCPGLSLLSSGHGPCSDTGDLQWLAWSWSSTRDLSGLWHRALPLGCPCRALRFGDC